MSKQRSRHDDARTELVAALARTDLFQGLSDDVLVLLADQMRTAHHEPGDHVLEEGTGGQLGRMYVVLDGTADAVIDDVVIASYGPGDHFGEMSLLDGEPRTATVVATGPLRLAGLTTWNLRATIKEEPEIAVHLIEVLSRRLRETNRRLAES